MVKIESYCGIDCSKCQFFEQGECAGCKAVEGKPFWTQQDNSRCKVAECNINRKRDFCGECGEFPCELLQQFAFDKEQGDNGERLENDKRWKIAKVKEARVGINPIAICGLHCDNCFMGQWCGGCRSTYNCCSYATMYEDGICPNVRCVNEKGLDGCYQCKDLENCTIGFYSNEDKIYAKTVALFIKKYGEEKYSIAIKKATEDGITAKDYTKEGNTEKAIKLLEKYL